MLNQVKAIGTFTFAQSSAPLFIGLVECWSSAKQALALALLFSGACLEEFLDFPGLSGGKIGSDSHVH